MRTEEDSEAVVEGPNRRSVLRSLGVAGTLAVGTNGVGTAETLLPGPAQSEGVPTARGTLEQVYVRGAAAEATVTLYGPNDETIATGTADTLGSYVFEDIEPAEGYTVSQTVDGSESPMSEPVTVLAPDYTPPQSLYDDQTLEEGFGYMEVRDGVTLAHQVMLPANYDPPYPTLVIYSGYEPSVNTVGQDVVESTVVEELGYAVVGVNKRGSACSGGRFDFGELLQMLDGYDAIETVAAQDWADGVGMIGASYPGFTQLFVAAMQPPSLEAIAPGAPIGDFYRDTVYPGGMRNATFASIWAGDRDSAFEPGGEAGNVDSRIENGDETCEANQKLSLQNEKLVEQMLANEFDAGLFEERGVSHLLGDIEVPTMLVTSWQDEQTGGRSARLLERLDEDTTVRFVGTNGDHYEYIGPQVMDDLRRFLSYYVAEAVPEGEDGPFEDALAAYEAEDPFTTYWELSGDGTPRFEKTWAEWPPEPVETWTLYGQPDGRLRDEPPRPATQATASYEYLYRTAYAQLITRTPATEGQLEWPHQPDGSFVSFVSDELAEDRVCLGSGAVELWLASTASDTDLQVTLSEIRPDGNEQFVQTGWLRASRRVEDPERNKPRRPYHTHLPEDAAEIPDGEFINLRVELFPFGHVFREGSRVKIAVESPGGNRDLWGFALNTEEPTNEVALTEAMPSNVSLPLVPGETAGEATLPDCGTVQNQPCRESQVALPPAWGSVTGTVTDSDGAPAENVTIEIAETTSRAGDEDGTGPDGGGQDGTGQRDIGPTEAGTVTTAADGTYAVDIPPGEYEFAVADAGFEPTSATATVTEDATSTLDLDVAAADPVLSVSAVEPAREGPVTTGETLAVDVTLANAGGGTVEEGTLAVTTEAGVTADRDSVSLDSLGREESQTVTVDLTAERPGETVVTFGASSTNAGETSITHTVVVELPPVVGDAPPRDLDGDGRYEVVSGGETADIADVQTLFTNLDSPVVRDHPDAFNFSGGDDEAVDVFDVQALFRLIND